MRKRKYRLYIYNILNYSFVTVLLSEEECIEEMKKRALSKTFSNTKSFRITRVEEGKDIIIYKGQVKSHY
jgi:hypothetical protein